MEYFPDNKSKDYISNLLNFVIKRATEDSSGTSFQNNNTNMEHNFDTKNYNTINCNSLSSFPLHATRFPAGGNAKTKSSRISIARKVQFNDNLNRTISLTTINKGHSSQKPSHSPEVNEKYLKSTRHGAGGRTIKDDLPTLIQPTRTPKQNSAAAASADESEAVESEALITKEMGLPDIDVYSKIYPYCVCDKPDKRPKFITAFGYGLLTNCGKVLVYTTSDGKRVGRGRGVPGEQGAKGGRSGPDGLDSDDEYADGNGPAYYGDEKDGYQDGDGNQFGEGGEAVDGQQIGLQEKKKKLTAAELKEAAFQKKVQEEVYSRRKLLNRPFITGNPKYHAAREAASIKLDRSGKVIPAAKATEITNRHLKKREELLTKGETFKTCLNHMTNRLKQWLEREAMFRCLRRPRTRFDITYHEVLWIFKEVKFTRLYSFTRPGCPVCIR